MAPGTTSQGALSSTALGPRLLVLLFVVTQALFCARVVLGGELEQFEVLNVPGYPGTLRSRHFSGYIAVDDVSERKLFFYFVTSESNPYRDPLVLWLNGGPGCSSMDGFIYEHGPFTFGASATSDVGVSLSDNPYSWSKVANMLYLDSPAGVGFSYSRRSSDYVTNDTHTAKDANVFLREFFRGFKHLQHNEFFITGESYGGIYVPNLAKSIVEGNKAGQEPIINLKGYAVGNGCTDEEYDGNAFPDFAVGKSLISRKLYNDLQSNCQGSFWNASAGSECERLLSRMQHEVAALNLYDILEDCYHSMDDDNAAGLRAVRGAYVAARRAATSWPLVGPLRTGQVFSGGAGLLGMAPPCVDTRLARKWLNSVAVRHALHVAPVSDIGEWTMCTRAITYTHDAGSMLGVHDALTKGEGLRVLVYSGDHDLCVPHTGSEAWTRSLGGEAVSLWQPWTIGDNQVAGYAVVYRTGITYATVKGAGHMVPQTNPFAAFELFKRFIRGRSPASSGDWEQTDAANTVITAAAASR